MTDKKATTDLLREAERQRAGINDILIRHGDPVRTEWTPELERLVREVGDYVEITMQDLLNSRSPANITALRVAFRDSAWGIPLFRKTFREAGWNYKGNNWRGNLQKIANLANEKDSDAADKINRALAAACKVKSIGKSGSITQQINFARSRGIRY